MKIHHTVTGLFLTSLLVACGGGGGGGGAPVTTGLVLSTLSFPFQSAYGALIQNGYTKEYKVIIGDCIGTAIEKAENPVSGATLGGVVNLLSVQMSMDIKFPSSNCASLSTVEMETRYFDSSTYMPQGNESSGLYRIYETPPVIPAFVAVLSSGRIGTLTNYSRSPYSKIGTSEVSYQVLPETDTTATVILNLTSVNYNNAGTVISTVQERYRIGTTGALTPISRDIQNLVADTKHLVFQ